MQNEREEPLTNDVGLILHRVVFNDCQETLQNDNINGNICRNDDKILSFQDLFEFTATNSMDISNTFLTFAEKNIPSIKCEQKEPIVKYVQPMQIEAFRVKF